MPKNICRVFLGFLFSGLMFSVSASIQVHSGTTVTVENIAEKLMSVKNSDRRVALTTFFNTCRAKQWASCNIAWFDLHSLGLGMVYHTKSGLESWSFEKDILSTNIYQVIVGVLSSNKDGGAWDLVLKPKIVTAEIPAVVLARAGLDDESWRYLALLLTQENMLARGVSLDVFKGFDDERAEWLRYLSLVFAMRNDSINSFISLSQLKLYVAVNKSDVMLYNRTLTAVQTYLSNQGK
jgi:hypothetical protein